MQSTLVPILGQEFLTYYRDGKEILSEQYDDQGQIVSTVVSRDDGSWHELFERKGDGPLTPVSTKELQKARKHFNFMKKNFTPFVDAVKQGNKKEAKERLDSIIEKINDGEPDSEPEQDTVANE